MPNSEPTLRTFEPHASLLKYVAYRCVVGSQAFGLATEESDVDRKGFFLPPAAEHWSLDGVPEQLENDATQECYWELEKFLRLALKANPSVLECLYSPLVETATPIAQELLAIRDACLSQRAHATYSGYVESQFRKLEHSQANPRGVKWKHAMHLIRLLLAGVGLLREGTLAVFVPDVYRDRLLAIRLGEVSFAEVDAWRCSLQAELDAALARTPLPLEPDVKVFDNFLIRARRSMVDVP